MKRVAVAAAIAAAVIGAALPVRIHPTITADGYLRCPAATAIPAAQLVDGADTGDVCEALPG